MTVCPSQHIGQIILNETATEIVVLWIIHFFSQIRLKAISEAKLH